MNWNNGIEYGDEIVFDYVNWKGEEGRRRTKIQMLYYGSTDYHPKEQWLLAGIDLDKDDFRVYAMSDMSNVECVKQT